MRRVMWLAAMAVMVGLSALAGAFVLNGWPPSAARAAPFADCDSQSWKAAAPGLLDDLPGFKCKTLDSAVVSGVNVRVVADEALTHPLVAEMAPQILQTAEKALPKYRGYRPSLALKNITFMIVSAPDRPDDAVASPGLGGECLVFIFVTKKLVASPVDRRAVVTPFVTAHELVHCTQYWNFAAQMTVPFAERSWWSEATADYLASSVVDDKKGLTDLWTNFDYKSRTTALTALDYDNYPFFAWLGGKKGVANTYSFMAAMPTGGGLKAQRNALVAQAGGADAVQDFATSFVDGAIKTPAGWTLPKPDLTVATISDSGDRTFTAEPFTLLRGGLKFAKGAYELSAKTSAAPEARWSEASGGWGPAPTSIGKTCDGDEAGLRYALFPVSAGKSTVTLKVTRTGDGKDGEDESCKKAPPKPLASCSPLPQRDLCLTGKWAVNGDKLTDMLDIALRSSGVYGPKDGTGWDGDAFVDFLSSGSGTFRFVKFELATSSHRPSAFILTTTNGDLAGDWSTSAGTLRFCPNANSVTIQTDTTLFGIVNGAVSKVQSSTTVPGAGEMQDFSYTCNAKSLVLKSKSGATLQGAPLVWYFSR